MIASYLPDSINIQSAGKVENLYAKNQGDSTLEELMRFKHSMEHIPKKEVPLFCIMLKINQT